MQNHPSKSFSVPSPARTCASAGKPDLAQTTVQQHLWTGHKATDMRMPACPQRSVATAAHRQLLDKEASESKWATTFRMAAESASQGAIGGVCKREGCRCLTPLMMLFTASLVSCTSTAFGKTAIDVVAKADAMEVPGMQLFCSPCKRESAPKMSITGKMLCRTGLPPKEDSPPK